MTRLRNIALLMVSVFAVAATSGCGAVSSAFGGDEGDEGTDDPNNPGGKFGGKGGNVGNLGEQEKCAESASQGKLTPVNLVFMYDRSGSMVQNNAKSKKWDPVVSATKSFFTSAQSSGISASLTYFPNGDINGGTGCTTEAYSSPDVPLTALPSASFGSSLDVQIPEGGTPTRPAMLGAIATAEGVAQSHPGEATVIVLVTDGIPDDGCAAGAENESSITNTAAEAANARAKGLKTYVIGVGGQLGSLNTIAQSGGSDQATIVQVSDPTGTAKSFTDALNKIRGQVGSCNFMIPAPPAGKQLDINKVNVVHTPGGGSPATLKYNASCTGGQGWHYDNPNSPKTIELCTSTCDAVKNDNGSKIVITLGCATEGKIN